MALVGTWCEGELRSGRPWPGVVRIPLNTWRYRLEQELGLAESNGRSLAPLPRTAMAAERLESTLASRRRRTCRVAKAAIFSSRRTSCEAIADMLQQLGIESVWQSEADACVGAVDIVVFDGWEQLAAHDSRSSNGRDGGFSPQVLLLHFPRGEDYERAASSAITAILTLPLLLSDLAAVIDKILPIPEKSRNATEGVPYSASNVLR